MSQRILVTHTARAGFTAEIAEFMGKMLVEADVWSKAEVLLNDIWPRVR
jgi:hypothetical protein